MCHKFYPNSPSPTKQRHRNSVGDISPRKMRNNMHYSNVQGSALVIAIFIIIVMSLLGAALVKMLASSQQNVVYEVLGPRAYAAAQSGIQWQLSQVFPLSTSGGVSCAVQSVIDANKPTFSGVNGLAQCSVSLKCSDFVIASTRYYTLEATGQCEAGPELTSRTIQVEARSLP
jgi:MSHA biogenesis protein MshP